MTYHTPSQAAKIAGCSVASIRNYCARFGSYFSPHAMPAPGGVRKFTADDLRLIHYVATSTAAGATLDAVDRALSEGALSDDLWQPPGSGSDAGQPEPDHGAALAVLASTLATQLESLRADLEAARQRESDLQRLVGQLEGKLEAGRPWWVRMFRG